MQRAYRDDMQCPHCGSNWLPKAGLSRGKQTYRCGECLHRFTPEGNRSYYPEEIKRQAIAMHTEGMGYAAISRVLGVKPETVYSWVKRSKLWLRWNRSARGGGCKLELRSYRLMRCGHMWALDVAISAIRAGYGRR